MSADAWRSVPTRDVPAAPDGAYTVGFRRGRAEVDDHPNPPPQAILRRLRRLAVEHVIEDTSGGRRVAADFHLVDGAEWHRSSILFRRVRNTLLTEAFKLRLPPVTVPEGVPEREAVESVAEPLPTMRPPVGGTGVYINAEGVPHVAYGSTVEPPKNENDGMFPGWAVTDFLAELKPAVERVVDGGRWSA